MNYTLTRNIFTPFGIFGILTDPSGNLVCYTSELPWNNNDATTSCIIDGNYTVTGQFQVAGFGRNVQICNNSGSGNIMAGDSLDMSGAIPVIQNSASTLTMLGTVLPSSFTLTIYGY